MKLQAVLAAAALATLLALPCAAAPQTAPYAVIDWPNKLNPDVVTLGHDDFLILTDKAFEVWNARTREHQAATGWPRHTAIENRWSRLAGGTVVVGESHTADTDIAFGSLVWWDPKRRSFAPPLLLPLRTRVFNLLSISDRSMLVCMSTNAGADWQAPVTKRAALVEFDNGALRIVPTTAVHRTALVAAGVRGTVDGTALDASAAPPAPLVYDADHCNWKMSKPPADLDPKKAAEIQPFRVGGRLLVMPGDAMPLLWNPARATWQAVKPVNGIAGIHGAHHNYGIEGPLVRAIGSNVEWFDPAAAKWKTMPTRLPDTYIPILAPLDDGATVVFMREEGRVMVLPAPR